MQARAYYNEIDPFAAEWLRKLIAAGHIAPGEVDERSIEDVKPAELVGFTQCHFFAGIGIWSLALRRGGWPDDRRVWTGSCPCQPFSSAGKGNGFADERHLWPAWFWLIEQCRPDVVFGEQVASRDGLAWLDVVSTDLENRGYAFGAVNLAACSVGAPHIRQRSFFLANAHEPRWQGGNGRSRGAAKGNHASGAGEAPGGLGNSNEQGQRQFGVEEFAWLERPPGPKLDGLRAAEWLADSCLYGVGQHAGELPGDEGQHDLGTEIRRHGSAPRQAGEQSGPPRVAPGPTNGFWRDADWLFCRDELWRPVRPGSFPLAHGAPARMGRLRAYGNAINVEAATAVIRAAAPSIGVRLL